MFKSFILALVIFSLTFVDKINAQAMSWAWANVGNGDNQDYGRDIAIDALGNSYVVGDFDGTFLGLGTNTLTNTSCIGCSEIYIAKYDPNGNFLWSQKAVGTGTDICYSVAVDFNNDIYITGSTSSPSITFGPITVSTNGGTDIFVAKYSSNGSIIWARTLGGINDETGNGVSVDPSGNVYVAGWFNSPTVNLGSSVLTNTGGVNIILLKYDINGNLIWGKDAGGSGFDLAHDISSDASGNLYVTGAFNSSSFTIGTSTLTNSGGLDILILKYDSNGNSVWAKSIPAANSLNNYDEGYSIFSNPNGDFCITGYYSSIWATFGTITLNNIAQGPGGGTEDIFIAKYDSNGNCLWANTYGTYSFDFGRGACMDVIGNVYVTGSYRIQPITFGSITLSNSGGDEVFTVKLDNSGNVIWATNNGGTSQDIGNGIAVDVIGQTYIAGNFLSANISFGSTVLSNYPACCAWDIFIAKLGISPAKIFAYNLSDKKSIHPNPFSEEITLDCNLYSDESTIAIYNNLGIKVKELKEICKNKITIQRDGLAPGLYILHLAEKGETKLIEKIIITD